MAKTKPVSERETSKGPRQARGRFVSRSIATSEQLGSVSLLADYLFRSCLPHLDVSGRMTGNPGLIKAGVAPLRDEINSRNLPELLRELANSVDHDGNPLVFWYEINGAKVLEFPGFLKHQTGLRESREAPSKFPARNGMEKLLHLVGGTPELLPQNRGVGTAQDEVEVEEEGEEEDEVRAARARKPSVNVVDDAWNEPQLDAETRPLFDALSRTLGIEKLASARRFLGRRSLNTWAAWIREMLKLVGPGSQFTADDLASVLDDDAALEQPITGPFALRTFLGKSRRERLDRSTEAPRANGASNGSGTGQGSAAILLQNIRELVEETVVPGQPIRRFIRKARVAELGADVVKAYEAIGGYDAVLNTPTDKNSFLIRDFSQALEAARHG